MENVLQAMGVFIVVLGTFLLGLGLWIGYTLVRIIFALRKNFEPREDE